MLCWLQVFPVTGAMDIFSFSIVYVSVNVSLRTDEEHSELFPPCNPKDTFKGVLMDSSPEMKWGLCTLQLLIFHSWMVPALALNYHSAGLVEAECLSLNLAAVNVKNV